MDHFEVYGVLGADGLEFSDLQQAILAQKPRELDWPVGVPIFVEVRRERKAVSALQRGYWFGKLIPTLANHIGDDEKSTHEDVKREQFPKLNLPFSRTRRWKSKRTGRWRQKTERLSLRDLNAKQMTDLIDLTRKWAGEFHGLEIEPPDPAWRQKRVAA